MCRICLFFGTDECVRCFRIEPVFERHNMDTKAFLLLEEGDLRDMGVPLGVCVFFSSDTRSASFFILSVVFLCDQDFG